MLIMILNGMGFGGQVSGEASTGLAESVASNVCTTIAKNIGG